MHIKWVDGHKLGLGCLGFGTSFLSPSSAEILCTSKGAHLVEIFNRNELDFIRQEAKNIGNHVAWDYWIGLRNKASVWTWSHSRKAFDWSLWGPRQPNDGNNAFPLAALLQDSDYYIYDVGHNSDHTYTKFALCQIKL